MEVRVCYSYHKDPALRRTKMPVLGKAERKELEAVAHKFGCQEMGFVEDLYLLLKSNGRSLMSRENAKKGIEPLVDAGMRYTVAYAKVTKQHNFMRKLRALPYFHKLANIPNIFEAVERLMTLFEKMYIKSQVAKCEACPMKKQCKFGEKIEDRGSSENCAPPVKLPDVNLLPADGCLTPPKADMIIKALALMNILAILTDRIQGSFLASGSAPTDPMSITAQGPGQGMSPIFDTTFTGEQTLGLLEKLVDDITEKQLATFELARTFNQTLLPGGEEDKDDTDHVAHDMRPRDMQVYEEVGKALPGEIVEDDIFYKKVVDGNLQVRQEMERVKKKQYFHILLDVSGSMRTPVSPNVYAIHSKGSFASALCLSVLKKVSLEQGTLMFRFFAGKPDRQRVCKDIDAFADLARMIGLSNFNGGGTDISEALSFAAKDIREQERDGMGKSEILLITDAEDTLLRREDLKKMLEGIQLHVLDVSPGSNMYNAAGSAALKEVSQTYYHVDPNNVNFEAVAKKAVGKNGDHKEGGAK